MKQFLLAIAILISSAAFGQSDTITIVQYNLLNYGDGARTTGYKNARLTTILTALQPDIFGANEIKNNPALSEIIRDSVLGVAWDKGAFINTGNEFHHNCLFWKKAKFGLKNQFSISSNLRDIIAYQLYFKQDPSIVADTIFFTVIVAHLKASNTTQDATDRAAETLTVKNYLNGLGHGGNFIFMGDMNVYTSNEVCYQNLVANTNLQGKLYDPINRPGKWNSVDSFAAIHTQATRTSQLSDSGATGGLDDRFDQMLVSGFIMGDSAGMRYLPGSYKAFGQDGHHYNKSIIDAPANTLVSSTITQALYEMSDHLPVTAKFVFDRAPLQLAVARMNNQLNEITATNPFDDIIRLKIPASLKERAIQYTLVTMMGQQVTKGTIHTSNENASINLSNQYVAQGLYFLRLEVVSGETIILKLIK